MNKLYVSNVYSSRGGFRKANNTNKRSFGSKKWKWNVVFPMIGCSDITCMLYCGFENDKDDFQTTKIYLIDWTTKLCEIWIQIIKCVTFVQYFRGYNGARQRFLATNEDLATSISSCTFLSKGAKPWWNTGASVCSTSTVL